MERGGVDRSTPSCYVGVVFKYFLCSLVTDEV
jgi:hypothetical protein